MRRIKSLPLAAILILLGISLAAKPADARVHFGFFFGAPIVIGPPAYYGYYPAPVYYYPPAYTYAPAPAPAPAGFTCYATPYVCPLPQAHAIGGPCACPAYGGTVAGTVR